MWRTPRDLVDNAKHFQATHRLHANDKANSSASSKVASSGHPLLAEHGRPAAETREIPHICTTSKRTASASMRRSCLANSGDKWTFTRENFPIHLPQLTEIVALTKMSSWECSRGPSVFESSPRLWGDIDWWVYRSRVQEESGWSSACCAACGSSFLIAEERPWKLSKLRIDLVILLRWTKVKSRVFELFKTDTVLASSSNQTSTFCVLGLLWF